MYTFVFWWGRREREDREGGGEEGWDDGGVGEKINQICVTHIAKQSGNKTLTCRLRS